MRFIERLKLLSSALTGQFPVKFYESFLLGRGFSFAQGNQRTFITEGYAKNSDVYAIIRKITSTASFIPWDLFDIKPDNEKELITDGDLFTLLKCPNRLQTRADYTEEALLFLLSNGNSFTAGTIPEGFKTIQEYNVLPAQEVEIIAGNAIDPIGGYELLGAREIRFTTEEVMHIKYPNPGARDERQLFGMSPLKAGFNSLQASNNTQLAMASIHKNMGISGIITDRGNRGMKPEQAKEMQDKWNAKQGASAFGKTLVTGANIDFVKMGMSPTDLKLIEAGVLTLRQLCNIYSVDSSLFNDPANKTFNNRREAVKSLYTEAVLPNLWKLIANLNAWLIPGWSKQDNRNYQIELNLSNIEPLQEDRSDKSKRIIEQRLSGILTGNEARQLLGNDKINLSEMDEIIISSTLKNITDENLSE